MADRTTLESLSSRFPELLKIGTRKRRRIPFVEQTAIADCGAACLGMVLAFHGKLVEQSEIRKTIGDTGGGVDAQSISVASRRFGLRGQGYKIPEVEDLRFLERGSILHWKFNHFVVLDRVNKRGAHIVDPALGRRFVTNAELNAGLTGVVLEFEPTADFHPSRIRKSRLSPYLRKIFGEKGFLLRVLGTSFIIQLLALSVPVLTGLIVDRIVPRSDMKLLVVMATGLAGIVGFQYVSYVLRSFLMLHLRTRLDAKLTLEFLDHMVDLPYSYFQQRSAGDLMMRLNSNTFIREVLTTSATGGLLDSLVVCTYLVLLLVANPLLGTIVLSLGVLRIGVFVATRQRHRDLMSEHLEVQAESQNYKIQILAGIETLKAFGAERRAVEHWTGLFVRELNVSIRRGRLDAVVNSFLDVLTTASPLTILILGAFLVIEGEMSLGTMLALNALAFGFLSPLSTLVSNAFQLQLLGSYLDRISDVLATRREQQDSEGVRLEKSKGKMVLEGLTFSYSPDGPTVLDEANLSILPGQMVGIVGPSGSGKSTMAALVAGLFQPNQGRVLFDGIDIRNLNLRWYRSQLGFVAQQPFIFGTTIRDNIALTNPGLPLGRVIEAAKTAEIHDDILAMAMGYDTVLADAGASLSGGQRQRIALARAIANHPKVLVLDEATSSLDVVTENRIQENLSELRSTMLVIAHRLSTIRKADKIYVVDSGRIVESGTHLELLDQLGLYHRLVSTQDREND